MTQTLDLNKMGLLPMNEFEMQEVDGGEWPKWVKGITWATIGKEIIDHWDEIKQGLKDGWNIDKN